MVETKELKFILEKVNTNTILTNASKWIFAYILPNILNGDEYIASGLPDKMGISSKTVNAALQSLEEQKFITKRTSLGIKYVSLSKPALMYVLSAGNIVRKERPIEIT